MKHPRTARKPKQTTDGKHPGGRPRKTVAELFPKWQQSVLELMGQGGSLVEVLVLLGISRDLHDRWLKDEPGYSETINNGLLLCEAWWTEQGRLHLTSGKNFNHGLWYMNMKNRFGWKDRNEVDVPDGITFRWEK